MNSFESNIIHGVFLRGDLRNNDCSITESFFEYCNFEEIVLENQNVKNSYCNPSHVYTAPKRIGFIHNLNINFLREENARTKIKFE